MFTLNMSALIAEVSKVFPEATFTLQTITGRDISDPCAKVELNVSVRNARVVIALGRRWVGVPDHALVSDILSGLVETLRK